LQNTDEIQHLLSQYTKAHKFRVFRPENYKCYTIHSHNWNPACYLSSRIKNLRYFRGQICRSLQVGWGKGVPTVVGLMATPTLCLCTQNKV